METQKISELRAGQGNVNVSGIITEMGEKSSFNKYGRELIIANAILQDDSGNIKLTLWNDDTRRFNEGDKIRIINGYVSEFQGEKQLTSGKFGRMEKAEDGENESSEKEKKEAKEEVSEESLDEEGTEEVYQFLSS